MTNSGNDHVTPAGGNIFADLGFAPEEASALKAASHAIIREKLATTSGVEQIPAAPTSGGELARTAQS